MNVTMSSGFIALPVKGRHLSRIEEHRDTPPLNHVCFNAVNYEGTIVDSCELNRPIEAVSRLRIAASGI
ncbi:hypothetical protein FF2_037708 [Malus domestica]